MRKEENKVCQTENQKGNFGKKKNALVKSVG